MAEPFSIAASALQVAGAGLSLAKTLHTYIEEVKSAQKHIKTVAVEVKLTASVLEHLGALLKENEAEKLCTQNVVSDAKDALSGCKDAFNEIEEAFKAVVKVQADGKRTVSATARFAWPFKKGKLEALQANLERLKSTLLLMLSVLSYAREKAARPTDTLSLQRVQIQNLIKAKDDATMRYEAMLVKMKKLETSDKTTTHRAPAVQGANSSWLNLHAAGGQLAMTPPAHLKDPVPIMDQLVLCTSAISSLAASVSAAMVSHSAGNGIEATEIERNFRQVKQAIASLVTSRPKPPSANSPNCNMGTAAGMTNRPYPRNCQSPVAGSNLGALSQQQLNALEEQMRQKKYHEMLQQRSQQQMVQQQPQRQMPQQQQKQMIAPPQQQQVYPQPLLQNHFALQDSQMQLILLERHRKKKLLQMARMESENAAQTQPGTNPPNPQTEGGDPWKSMRTQQSMSYQPSNLPTEIGTPIGREGSGNVSKKRPRQSQDASCHDEEAESGASDDGSYCGSDTDENDGLTSNSNTRGSAINPITSLMLGQSPAWQPLGKYAAIDTSTSNPEADAAIEGTSDDTCDDQTARPAKKTKYSRSPGRQPKQQKNEVIVSAPSGFPDDDNFQDMDLSLGEDFNFSAAHGELDTFDLDRFLNENESVERSFASGEVQRTDSPGSRNGAMAKESFLDSVEEIDDLVKRWTTIEV